MNINEKLNETSLLIVTLENALRNKTDNDSLKISIKKISEDLLKYKNFEDEVSQFSNYKDKLQKMLNKIKKLEENVNRQLLLTQKYNHFINS